MAQSSGGRQGGQLLLAAGAFTLVNDYLPGSGHLNLGVLNAVGVSALLLGAGALRFPWQRYSPRAPMALLPGTLALLVLSGVYGEISPYSYAVYYVVVFVWIGLAQPPRTSLWVAPVAAAAYLLPFLVQDTPPSTAIGSVTVAVPVCVLVAEVLARTVARLNASQDELRLRAEHEAAVVDVLADGVLVLDVEGRVRSCNEVATALLGPTPLGSPLALEIGPPGIAVTHEVGERWIETVVTVLARSGERVVVLRDTSRQRALDQAKDLFLATTSHELRTPLTAIKGYVHVLERRWDVIDDERRRAALATISERTDALVSLTDHLLLGARAGASRHSGVASPFPLGEVLSATLDGLRSLSDRHELTVALPDGPLPVLGDRDGVHHVVAQLVENAVKYSPGGGPVTVTARRDGDHAAVEVADRGIGVPPGQQETLFAPFFQAGSTNTREYAGVGLGLYIVRQLVGAQGGVVAARNRDGGGTVVRFTVPLAGSSTPLPRDGAPQGARAQPGDRAPLDDRARPGDRTSARRP